MEAARPEPVTAARRTPSDAEPRPGPRADVVTIGETMALVAPDRAVALERSGHLVLGAGGAESNVAMHLAGLGFRSRWVSRLGDDPLGRLVARAIGAAGVTVDAAIDPDARTGVYFKDPGDGDTAVHYYRDGSAASRLDVTVLRSRAVADARVLHLSGITAALSRTCHDLLRAAILDRAGGGALISFDVNHRPGLWSAADAAPVLAELADGSDVVFVGQDEAERLWGCTTPVQVREHLPTPTTVVVKDGDVAAHAVARDATVSVPALDVDVVEPVGAGDAFAAGYLAGLLEDADAAGCLRFGHLVAAQVLRVLGDQVALPPRAWFDARLALPDGVWARLDPASADLP